MVGVGVVDELTHALSDAVHLGLGGPHEGRHGEIGVERVVALVLRHFAPVDAAHVLAPAEHLADEALHGVEGRLAALVGLHHLGDGVARVEKMEIERGGETRVIEIGAAA